ncbi:MAG: hypothetical protein HYY33_09510 [Chloroflexi bacterium]|nr:hypothetical protein [Chloroflexota bacterium]
MSQLRRATIALIIDLTFLYNLERVDFGQQNIIDIQSFVYILAMVAVIATLSIPLLNRAQLWVSLVLWSAAYMAAKLFLFASRPAFGGVYTYITITELALLLITVWLAYHVAHYLRDFEDAVENITFNKVSQRVKRMGEMEDDIQNELLRSRRHRKALSVVVIAPEPASVRATLHRTVQEVQRAMMSRYIFTSLASVISKDLRRTDIILEQSERGRYIVLSPETTAAGIAPLVDRICRNAARLGVALSWGVASFPDDALTFDELVRQAQSRLHHPALIVEAPDQPAADAPAET